MRLPHKSAPASGPNLAPVDHQLHRPVWAEPLASFLPAPGRRNGSGAEWSPGAQRMDQRMLSPCRSTQTAPATSRSKQIPHPTQPRLPTKKSEAPFYLWILLVAATVARAETVISPNAPTNFASSAPFTYSSVADPTMRYQQVYGATDFTNLGSPMLITAMLFGSATMEASVWPTSQYSNQTSPPPRPAR